MSVSELIKQKNQKKDCTFVVFFVNIVLSCFLKKRVRKMKKETTNIEEEYIEKSNKLFERIDLLNENALVKMNYIHGLLLLVLAVILTLSTFVMKSEVEDHHVNLKSFLSVENKDMFDEFNQQFLLGASEYSLSINSMIATLSKTDMKDDKTPDLILKFEDNIVFWSNLIIVMSVSVSIIAFIILRYFSKRSMTYEISDYNNSTQKYEQIKINKFDEYKDLNIIYFVLLSFCTVIFKFNVSNEETDKLFCYSLEVLDPLLNMFYIVAIVLFIWSIINICWGVGVEKLNSSLLNEKSECIKDKKELLKIEIKIIENKKTLLSMNKRLTDKSNSEKELIAIRNSIAKSIMNKDTFERLSEESKENEKILNQKDNEKEKNHE